MKTINEYIIDVKFNNATAIIESEMIAEEYMVTESFKSSIIQKLAQAIWDYEKENNQRKLQNAKDQDERYGTEFGKHDPRLVSFASIFGPIKVTSRGGKSVVSQGLKWSEIKDDDFIEYAPGDKELISLIKKTYRKDDKADFIIMRDDKIINFIKAYSDDNIRDTVYYFKADEFTNWGKIPSSVKELKKKYYSYQERNLKTDEVLDLLETLMDVDNVKVYALKITDDMLKDYSSTIKNREEAKKGVINYDKASLELMLRNQKARYKAIVEEIKAKKLTDNKDALFDDVKKVNEEVVEFVQLVLSKPEYMEKFYEAGNLMSYVADAYHAYYQAINGFHKSEKYKESSKRRAEEKGEKWDEESFDKWDFDKEHAKDSIRRVEEYIKEIRQKIDTYKKELPEK